MEHSTVTVPGGKSVTGGKVPLLQREVRLFGTSFSNKRKEDFYTELSVLLRAGITLKDGLGLIAENQKKREQRIFYSEMVEGLVSGKSFSEIIQGKKEFTEYEYHSLRIGEESGTVSRITEELGTYYARKNEHRRNLINALTYPIIIMATAILVVVFMLRLVVPMFQDIFAQNNVELPWITKMIMAASDLIRDHGLYLLLFLAGAFFLGRTFAKGEGFKRRRDHLLLRLPYAGNFIKAVYLAQFTQAVTLLTASKVPLLNSIELVGRMIDFYPLKDALGTVGAEIMKGSSLSDSLKGNKIFDHRMITLVKVAEETNRTEFIFERLNQQYNIEVQQRSKLLSTLMEPLIIVFVGILVGVILVAMYLPMFKLGSALG